MTDLIPIYIASSKNESIEEYLSRLTAVSYSIDYSTYSPEVCVTGRYDDIDLIYHPADTFDTMLEKYNKALQGK